MESLGDIGGPVCELVDELLADEIATRGPVRAELPAGAPSERHLETLRALLGRHRSPRHRDLTLLGT